MFSKLAVIRGHRKIKCVQCNFLFALCTIKRHLHICIGVGGFKEIKASIAKPRKAWNKGLTKETDSRILKGYKNRCKSLANWRNKLHTKQVPGTATGRVYTKEQRRKLSESKRAYLILHPEQVPFRLAHSSKISYPEKVFKKALRARAIRGWKYNYSNSIYSYDFAWPTLKLDVEIDGGTHLSEKVKQIDKRRDRWSRSQGWRVIRFTAKEVQNNIDKVMQQLLSVLPP